MATRIISVFRTGIALLSLLFLLAGTTAYADLLDVRVDFGTGGRRGNAGRLERYRRSER